MTVKFSSIIICLLKQGSVLAGFNSIILLHILAVHLTNSTIRYLNLMGMHQDPQDRQNTGYRMKRQPVSVLNYSYCFLELYLI